MAEINPPGFMQNAGSTHTAEITREPYNALLAVRHSGTWIQRGRGGVNPGLGAAYAVTQNGTPNMSVNIGSGHAMVPGTESTSQGNYSCYSDSTINRSITASDPSLPRIDLAVVRVRDSFYSGATNAFAVEIVTGVAASSPAVPSTPANSIVLAQIRVNAGTSSVVNANITDVRPFLSTIGGTISVAGQTERDALSGPYESLTVWRRDTKMLQVYDGSSYLDFPGEVGLRPIRLAKGTDESVTSNATLHDDNALFTGTLPANSIWWVHGTIFYLCTGSPVGNNGGISWTWGAPSGATFKYTHYAKINNDPTNSASTIFVTPATLADTPNTGGAINELAFKPDGELAIGATPGQLKFRWAQYVSTGNPCIVKAGSRIYLHRVG